MDSVTPHKNNKTELEKLREENTRLQIENQIYKSNLPCVINENCSDGILVVETIYGVPIKIKYANKGFKKLLGMDHLNLLDTDPLELLAGGQKKRVLNASDKILSEANLFMVIYFKALSGKTVPLELSVQKVKEENNPVLVITARDIERRNKQLMHLPTHEQSIKKITEGTNEVVFHLSLSPTLVFEYVSFGAQKVLGYKPLAFYNDKNFFFDNLHPNDYKTVLKTFYTKNSVRNPLTVRFLRGDEKLIWIEIYLNIEYNSDGKPIGIHGIIHDITYRQKTDRLLNKKLMIENLMTKISTSFIDYKNFYHTIEETINHIGETLSLDSIEFCLCNLSINTFTHKWSKSNSAEYKNCFALSTLPNVDKKLKSGELLYISDITNSDLSYEEVKHLSKHEIKSILATPLQLSNNYIGYISMFNFRKNRHWDRVEIQLASTYTNIVTQAIRKEVILRQKDRLFKKVIDKHLILPNQHPSLTLLLSKSGTIIGSLNADYFSTDGKFKRFENLALEHIFSTVNAKIILSHINSITATNNSVQFNLKQDPQAKNTNYTCYLSPETKERLLLCLYPTTTN